jgi:hypothetical protein
VRAVILENIPVSLDSNSTIENGSLDFGKVLGETLILMRNLKGKLTSVTQDQHADLILPGGKGAGVQLMESGQDKHGSLSHTRLGLADNVHTKNSLGDALVLHFGGVLETTVNDGTEAFGFEDKVLETGGVNSYVMTPDVFALKHWT